MDFMQKLLPAPIARLLLPKPRQMLLIRMVHVPAGHTAADGEVFKIAFNAQVEAGIRWHPEWPEPLAHVRAFRFFCMGDALVWDGENVEAYFGTLLPAPLRRLAKAHGQPVNREVRELAAELGLEIPTRPNPLAHFISRPNKHLHNLHN